MASSNTSHSEPVTTRMRRIAERAWTTFEPIATPVYRGGRFVTGSFFRFLIVLGLVLLATGAFVVDGILAGHLGIYGSSAVIVGIVGRLVIRWKLKDSS